MSQSKQNPKGGLTPEELLKLKDEEIASFKKHDRARKMHKAAPKGYIQNPFWYASKENIDKIASFNWASALGDLIKLNPNKKDGIHTPGVMVCKFTPSFGFTGMPEADFITKCADAYFNSFTQGYTGSVPYEATDIFLTMLAAESVFDLLILGKRMYAIHNWASIFNRYLPKAIFNACGWDYDDFRRNLADFAARLNTEIAKIQEWVKVPTAFLIADRWEYLCSNIFSDYDDFDKSQLYMYYPQRLLKLNKTDVAGGGALEWVNVPNFTVTTYFDMLDSLLDALRSQDTNNMFGSLMKIYKPEEFKKLSPLDTSFILPITHDQICLEQLHNTTVCPIIGGAYYEGELELGGSRTSRVIAPYALIQDNGKLISRPVSVYKLTIEEQEDAIFVDVLRKGYPGPEVFIDALADTIAIGNEIDASPVVQGQIKYEVYCRCDIIEGITMIVFEDDPGNSTGTYQEVVRTYDFRQKATAQAEVASESMLYATTFNYHPVMRYYSDQSDGKCLLIGEIANFGSISKTALAKCHSLCFAQLLGMPVFSKSVTR